MIVYLYFKDKKNCENLEKKLCFFLKCKMFLKKRMRVRTAIESPILFFY
jgi:hypothetical protein